MRGLSTEEPRAWLPPQDLTYCSTIGSNEATLDVADAGWPVDGGLQGEVSLALCVELGMMFHHEEQRRGASPQPLLTLCAAS